MKTIPQKFSFQPINQQQQQSSKIKPYQSNISSDFSQFQIPNTQQQQHYQQQQYEEYSPYLKPSMNTKTYKNTHNNKTNKYKNNSQITSKGTFIGYDINGHKIYKTKNNKKNQQKTKITITNKLRKQNTNNNKLKKSKTNKYINKNNPKIEMNINNQYKPKIVLKQNNNVRCKSVNNNYTDKYECYKDNKQQIYKQKQSLITSHEKSDFKTKLRECISQRSLQQRHKQNNQHKIQPIFLKQDNISQKLYEKKGGLAYSISVKQFNNNNYPSNNNNNNNNNKNMNMRNYSQTSHKKHRNNKHKNPKQQILRRRKIAFSYGQYARKMTFGYY